MHVQTSGYLSIVILPCLPDHFSQLNPSFIRAATKPEFIVALCYLSVPEIKIYSFASNRARKAA